MLKPYKKCPVPILQQPRNEYNTLRQASLFAFTLLPSLTYYLRLFTFLCFAMILLAPFAILNVNGSQNPISMFFIDINVSVIILLMILLRTYLGWSYICKRLLSAIIVYEESGWYDVEIWIKTPLDLAQDRLVAEYTVKPILRRIQQSTIVLLLYLFIVEIKNVI
uniref:hypothetical protein n=1 Tax=Chroothece richteriana TaxID=101928 RepID=UPI001FCD7386|nr:hypothetical protein MW631_pgp068 [Chroothece richteriana]UNJ14240.1 hypothetical protein [Chroothece richteriana]